GECLTLLDGSVRDLQAGTLVIADSQGPLALAGIMGGQHSGVSAETRAVLLEAAFFEPVALAGKAGQYGLHTASSPRIERGVDAAATGRAMERATRLLLELAGGQAGPVLDCRSEADLPVRPVLPLRQAAITRMLGLDMASVRVTAILAGLGCDARADG